MTAIDSPPADRIPGPSAGDDPDRGRWEWLAAQRHEEERLEAARGMPARPVRRMRVGDDAMGYQRTLFSLAVDIASHTAHLYMVGADHVVGTECPARRALAAFTDCDPAAAAGFTVTRAERGTFTLACEGVSAVITREQRATVIAFLL